VRQNLPGMVDVLLAGLGPVGAAAANLRILRMAGPLDGHPCEDMTETLVPGAAPVGWVAVVRPDRTVLHDGPLEELETVMRESLALLGGAPTRKHVPRAVMEVSL